MPYGKTETLFKLEGFKVAFTLKGEHIYVSNNSMIFGLKVVDLKNFNFLIYIYTFNNTEMNDTHAVLRSLVKRKQNNMNLF